MRSEARRQLVMLRLRGEQVARQQWEPRPDGPLPLSFAQQRLWFGHAAWRGGCQDAERGAERDHTSA